MKKPLDRRPMPFGLNMLVEVPEAEALQVNGGRRKHHAKPPFHLMTLHISLPQPGLPTGDHG